MSSTISATSTGTSTDALFTKLDTNKKGYLDAADLKTAAGATAADDAKAAEAFKQIDTDSDGKVTKSELSTAIDKVSDQLNAQLDSSRAASSAAGAKPAGGGGGGAPPVASASSDTETAKYVAAADTDSDGTVTAAEAAAYKKLEAASAEAKALAQVQEYKDNSGTTEAATSGTVDVSV